MRRLDEVHMVHPWPAAGCCATSSDVKATPSAASGSARSWPAWASNRSIANPPPASDIQLIQSTRTCCAIRRSNAEITCGHGHHLHSDEARHGVPVCRHGLEQPEGAGVVPLQYADPDFCVEGLQEALSIHTACPYLPYRSGQPVHRFGVHQLLKAPGIQISMDGTGC
jgi:hypothetical protein